MAKTPPRKLAVILHTDVVGSTKLVQMDESIAHERIRAAFQRFSTTIESYGGTAHEIRGDALVAEFSRASDAVFAALAFQAENTEYNRTLSDDIRPELRVGVSMGEVVVADNTVTGEAVVLAQRLEQLAEPGGICVQGSVYEAVPGRMPFDYTSLGEREVKGFDQPVRAFSVALKHQETIPAPEPRASPQVVRSNRRWIIAAFSLIVVVAGLGAWFVLPTLTSVSAEDPPSLGTPGLAIAVLPFTNLSGDKDQDYIPDVLVPPIVKKEQTLAVLPFTNLGGDLSNRYFSNGLSEDLTTDLSKVPGLTVIAHASSIVYPNAEQNFKEIARNLGVRYLVRGTVRHHGDRVRINVSLFDPDDGFSRWSERYDRSLLKPFDVQEEVVRHIVDALSLTLETAPIPARRIQPDAYHMLLKGLEPLRAHTPDGNFRARKYFKDAIALDPGYARAHASVAVTYGREIFLNDPNEHAGSIEKGLQAAIRAIQLDPNVPHAYYALGMLNLSLKKFDTALAAVRHAIKLDKNFADGYALLAEIAIYGGDLNEALIAIERAKLLHPNHPATYDWIEAYALYLVGLYEDARPVLEEAVTASPEFYLGLLALAATYGQLGDMDAGEKMLSKARDVRPDVDPVALEGQFQFMREDRLELLTRGLTKLVKR